MGRRPVRKYEGSCHCGAVRFAIETDFPELTTCDCSICRRKNALMVKVHESRFWLLCGEESLSDYQFHTLTAHHYFSASAGFIHFTENASRLTTLVLMSIACLILTRQAFRYGIPTGRAWHDATFP